MTKLVPDTLEEAFFAIDELLKVIYAEDPDAKVLICFDSLGGTPSAAEAEADADDSIQLATAAKVIKRNLRVLVPRWVGKKDVAWMVINTNYANIGSHGRSNSGGDGLEFATVFIIQLARTGDIIVDKGNMKIKEGIKTRANVTKNHLQTKETSIKSIDYETRDYNIVAIAKYAIKKGAQYVNDDGRLIITKVSRKDGIVEYCIEPDASNEIQRFTQTKEEVLSILENGDYEYIEG